MTEATQVNGAVRHHLGPYGRFVRVEDAFTVGVPDWYYRCRGSSGWLEAKLVPRSGRCPPAFTREQLMWGEAEATAGGSWFLLGLRDPRVWLLYDAARAREWFDRVGNRPLLELTGKFPTREVLDLIAPRRSAAFA